MWVGVAWKDTRCKTLQCAFFHFHYHFPFSISTGTPAPWQSPHQRLHSGGRGRCGGNGAASVGRFVSGPIVVTAVVVAVAFQLCDFVALPNTCMLMQPTCGQPLSNQSKYSGASYKILIEKRLFRKYIRNLPSSLKFKQVFVYHVIYHLLEANLYLPHCVAVAVDGSQVCVCPFAAAASASAAYLTWRRCPHTSPYPPCPMHICNCNWRGTVNFAKFFSLLIFFAAQFLLLCKSLMHKIVHDIIFHEMAGILSVLRRRLKNPLSGINRHRPPGYMYI